MPRVASVRSPKQSAVLVAEESAWRWLTQLAFFLALVLVIARAAMMETVHNEVLPVAGAAAVPATPGATTGLILDLLFCLPAMLVLLRRVIDKRYALCFSWSHLIMFALAAWTLLSVFWSGDKFLAIVSAAHWAAALVLLWAASQVVSDWRRLRIVAAVSCGLLLVLLIQGYYYRFVDLPDLQTEWKQNQAEMLRQRGADANSIMSIQIGKNIEGGEVTGFSLSRNTYAAMLVLLGIVTLGVVIQRVRDKDHVGWVIPLVVVLALSLLMLYRYVFSKTAYATPFIGAALLTMLWFGRRWVSSHGPRLYCLGVAAFIVGAGAVIGHGIKHGTLLQLSLTYRWQYWVGATKLFMHHFWLGVGWANFGGPYLAYRLPQAIEEIKDPHNFIVRAFTELGVVGGVLMIAWMLRLWWELTARQVAAPVQAGKPAPQQDTGSPGASPSQTFSWLLILPLASMGLNALISIDWQQQTAWIILELFKRGMFLVALIIGMGLVGLRSMKDQRLDDRHAIWLLWAMLVALGLFLLHNLIDFSLFEPGPMFLFALLAGSALGMRLPSSAHPSGGRAKPLIALIAAAIAWLLAVGGMWNVAMAESLATDADEQVRTNHSSAALNEYVEASKLLSINGDYAYRAALLSSNNAASAQELLLKAISADPSSVRYRRSLAELELNVNNLPAAFTEFEHAVALDPQDMELRIEYADALRAHGEPEKARGQYERALALNSQLSSGEIRRLSPAIVQRIRQILQ